MIPDNANDQLRNGQVLADRYVVEQVIGRGGMAEVYRGRDTRLARPVALKVLRARFGLDPALRLRFEEEAKAAALVSHPNIVAVYDAGEDDSKAFIVMELVAGETLHERILRGPLDVAAARSVGREVLDALGAAHAKGVLHRDIKPANVLLTAEGQAKVADFGIAKAVHPSPDGSNETTMNMVLGTPSYLAPERAQGEPATVRSDLWAVGVLLYEALTGAKPFEGDNPIAISLAAQQARFVPLLDRRPDLDPALAAVIERAIDTDPARRFASAGEMADALSDRTAEATQILGGAALGGAAIGAAAVAAGAGDPNATQMLDDTAARQHRLGAGAAAGLGAAGAAAAAGAATAGLAAGRAGASTYPTAAMATGRHDAAAAGPAPRHRGAAVLIGAAVAVLLGGILALLLTSSNNPKNAPRRGHSHSTVHLVGSTPTTRATTTTPTTTPSTSTSSSSSSTTPTTTQATTTTARATTTTSSSTSVPTTTTPPTSTIPSTTLPTSGTSAPGGTTAPGSTVPGTTAPAGGSAAGGG